MQLNLVATLNTKVRQHLKQIKVSLAVKQKPDIF